MAADKDSSLTSPEQVYRHDVGGNRVLEEGWYNTTYYNVHKTALLTGKKPGGGCGGGGSACIEEIRDEGGSETGSIQYVYGKGQMGIVHELAEYDNGAGGFDTIHRYRHEDQSGSLIGVTDEDGYRTHEYWYEDFGAPISKPIIFDGQMARISGVTHDSPNPDETTITITGTTLSTDQFNGAELAVSDPDDGSDRLRIGTVLDTTSTTIVVSDAGTYDIAAGLYEGAGDGGTVLNNFVIYEFNDSSEFDAPSYHSGGEWTSAPNLDDNGTPSIPGDDTTDFEDTNGNFAAYQVGWKLIADVELFAPLTIVDIPDTITLTVAGDASTLAASGSRYRVVAPPGVDVSTGALETNTNDAGSRYLYVEMRYNPPQVGYYVDPPGAPLLGTYGAQTGDSLVGTYVIAKDVYKPETGTLLSMPSDIPRDPWGPPEPDPRFDEERAQKQYGERKGAPPGDPSDTEMRSCWDSWTRSGNFEEFRYWEFHVDWFDGWYSSAEENEANNPNAPVNRNRREGADRIAEEIKNLFRNSHDLPWFESEILEDILDIDAMFVAAEDLCPEECPLTSKVTYYNITVQDVRVRSRAGQHVVTLIELVPITVQSHKGMPVVILFPVISYGTLYTGTFEVEVEYKVEYEVLYTCAIAGQLPPQEA